MKYVTRSNKLLEKMCHWSNGFYIHFHIYLHLLKFYLHYLLESSIIFVCETNVHTLDICSYNMDYSMDSRPLLRLIHLHECLTDILMIKMYAHINSTTIGVGKSERAQNSPNSSSNNQNRWHLSDMWIKPLKMFRNILALAFLILRIFDGQTSIMK